MKNLTFMRGVLVAFVLSLAGAAVFAALTPTVSGNTVIRAVIALVSLAYVLVLLSASGIRFGRVTSASAMLMFTAVTLYLPPPLAVFTLIHIGFIWLARCFYYHNSLVTAAADLGLCLLAFAGAIWAMERSHSLFMSIWCFLLIQAAIPPLLQSVNRSSLSGDNSDQRFQRAYRSAEAALRKASATH